MPAHDWTRVDAGIFHDFHTMWLVSLRNAIKRVLPTGYTVMTEQKALDYELDILALHQPRPHDPGGTGNGPVEATNGTEGGISVATVPPKVLLSQTAPNPATDYKRRWIAVRHVSGKRVVAIVEVVSPGNKSSQDAIRAFTAKVAELLERGVHVLVIDLFPPTSRDPDGIHRAVWGERAGDYSLPRDRPLTLVSYVAGQKQKAHIQPIAVEEPLVDMPLFLTEERYVYAALESSYSAAFAEVDAEWKQILTAPAT
jgi:hypothetical protein